MDDKKEAGAVCKYRERLTNSGINIYLSAYIQTT